MSKKTINIDPHLGDAGAGFDSSVTPSVLKRTLQDMADNADRIVNLQATQKSVAVNGAANTTLAENTVGFVLVPGDLVPFVGAEGAATADGTNYATLTFKLYRAGAVVNTWTLNTKPVASGGTGDWADGGMFEGAATFAALKGDKVTITEAKSGSGVQLPPRAHGFRVI